MVNDEDGHRLGELVWNPACTQLDAHCDRHGCHMDRTLLPGRKKGQGRPIGALVLWLLQGHRHNNKHSHNDAKKTVGSVYTLAERRRARALLRSHAGSEAVFALERAPHPGENSEPDVFT